MKKAFVIIDNGHGAETPGKCSPDGQLKEWAWTRQAAKALAAELKRRGIGSTLLVSEARDVPLRERVRAANEISRLHDNAVLVSLHTNASRSDGRWGDACGWSVFTAPGASEKSRRLARLLYEEACARYLKGNRSTPAEGYWTASLAMCRDTVCPAVLTENLFHDHAGDAAFLLSSEGLRCIVELHADAIEKYYATL